MNMSLIELVQAMQYLPLALPLLILAAPGRTGIDAAIDSAPDPDDLPMHGDHFVDGALWRDPLWN